MSPFSAHCLGFQVGTLLRLSLHIVFFNPTDQVWGGGGYPVKIIEHLAAEEPAVSLRKTSATRQEERSARVAPLNIHQWDRNVNGVACLFASRIKKKKHLFVQKLVLSTWGEKKVITYQCAQRTQLLFPGGK